MQQNMVCLATFQNIYKTFYTLLKLLLGYLILIISFWSAKNVYTPMRQNGIYIALSISQQMFQVSSTDSHICYKSASLISSSLVGYQFGYLSLNFSFTFWLTAKECTLSGSLISFSRKNYLLTCGLRKHQNCEVCQSYFNNLVILWHMETKQTVCVDR